MKASPKHRFLSELSNTDCPAGLAETIATDLDNLIRHVTEYDDGYTYAVKVWKRERIISDSRMLTKKLKAQIRALKTNVSKLSQQLPEEK